jgi:radical SAM protein (TIGR01212 family)
MLPHERYNGFNVWLQNHFGEKVHRVGLNAGFTCPNIDGTKAKGGCYFCNDDYLLGKSFSKTDSVETQLDKGIAYIRERFNVSKFLAYFQSGTNTHAPVQELKGLYEMSLTKDGVVGIMISTRPDSLPEDVLDLLSELNEKTHLWVEMGLQSHQDKSLDLMNRAHSVDEYVKAVHQLHERKIRQVTHMIVGMPGENEEDVFEGLSFINDLPVDGIKIHNMFVPEHTVLAKWYREGKYEPWTLERFAKVSAEYVARLRKDIVIHRLNATCPKSLCVAPDWAHQQFRIVNAVHDELVKNDWTQGCIYKSNIL